MNNSDMEIIHGNISIEISGDCSSYRIRDTGLLSSIRHRLKNQLNFLSLAEYECNGNNKIIKSLANDIDQIIHEDFLFEKIEINQKNEEK
jgi:Fe-S cluster biogenesis protein NfuA